MPTSGGRLQGTRCVNVVFVLQERHEINQLLDRHGFIDRDHRRVRGRGSAVIAP